MIKIPPFLQSMKQIMESPFEPFIEERTIKNLIT